MRKLTKVEDAKKYMCAGKMTAPFLHPQQLVELLKQINALIDQGVKYAQIKGIIRYIHAHIKPTNDANLKAQHKFNRTASEIWASGFSTGCTDYALLFCAIARQISIPTTFLSAIGLEYANLFKAGKAPKMHQGHAFCECFVTCQTKGGEAVKNWVLVDPTADELVEAYQSNKNISLPYSVGGEHNFIPFFRDVDILHKTTQAEWNKKMDEFLDSLIQN